MIHGIHRAFFVLGGMTILSTIVFRELKRATATQSVKGPGYMPARQDQTWFGHPFTPVFFLLSRKPAILQPYPERERAYLWPVRADLWFLGCKPTGQRSIDCKLPNAAENASEHTRNNASEFRMSSGSTSSKRLLARIGGLPCT